ncbi:MAG: hypothetical protein EON86_06510, partial [Brevundimonas sp.]
MWRRRPAGPRGGSSSGTRRWRRRWRRSIGIWTTESCWRRGRRGGRRSTGCSAPGTGTPLSRRRPRGWACGRPSGRTGRWSWRRGKINWRGLRGWPGSGASLSAVAEHRRRGRGFEMKRFHLMSGAAVVAGLMAVSAPAGAQALRAFDIPAGALADGLNRFAAQSGQQIFFTGDLVAGRRTPGLRGPYAPADALNRLLEGSGLAWTETRPGVIVLRRADARAAVEGEAAELAEVVVTGTLLRHAGDIASPVVRLDREALDRRGFATVAEALIDLPQNFAGSTTPVVALANADPGASNTVQSTGVNLRGLGPASTLVLVNGRRLAGSGSRAEFADLSALPSAAVERVDVLLDGASALYGADAVAGVVNVIMRSRFDGQETRLRVAAARGGGEDLMVSHLAGTSWDGGSAYLAVEHQQTHGLSSFDRPFTADGDLRPWGGSDRRFLYGTPGNIVAFNATLGVYESRFAIRPNASGRAQGPGDFAAGQANLQSSTYGTDLIPALVRTSAYGRV